MMDAARVHEIVVELERLRVACEYAREACRDNLKMWQYKNEPALMHALKRCDAALQGKGYTESD